MAVMSIGDYTPSYGNALPGTTPAKSALAPTSSFTSFSTFTPSGPVAPALALTIVPLKPAALTAPPTKPHDSSNAGCGAEPPRGGAGPVKPYLDAAAGRAWNDCLAHAYAARPDCQTLDCLNHPPAPQPQQIAPAPDPAPPVPDMSQSAPANPVSAPSAFSSNAGPSAAPPVPSGVSSSAVEPAKPVQSLSLPSVSTSTGQAVAVVGGVLVLGLVGWLIWR